MGDLHPSVIIGVMALASLYAGALYRTGRRVTTRQALSFAAALAVILFSLCGPIDDLVERRLFMAHIAQHLLLCLVLPPLLLYGLPDWMLRPIMSAPVVRPLARIFLNPVVAFFAYNSVLVLIHAPRIFDLMCRNEAVHITVHLALMAAGIVMWWPLLSPLPELPRLSYPGQMLYLFLMLIPMAAVAAPITLSQNVIYHWYLEGPHPFGISPLSDQVGGGIIMWVGAGFYEICVATVIFARWASRDDRDEPSVGRPIVAPVRRPHLHVS